MTLTLELTPQEEARLHKAAAQEGLDAEEFVLQAIKNLLPNEPTGKHILRGYGLFANSPQSVEDFERESREDKAKEEYEAFEAQ